MKFEITLKAEFYNNSPNTLFKVNDAITAEENNFIDGKEKIIIFEADVRQGKNLLEIERKNKTNDDTLVEDGQIVKDSTVKIIEVLMDRNVVGRAGQYPFLLDSADYFPEYPEPWYTEQREKGDMPPESYKHCQILNHNGSWKLQFENPVDYWFFEYYSGKRKFR